MTLLFGMIRDMRSRILLILLSGIMFLGFVLFSYIVHENIFTQTDFNTTVRLQDNIPRRVDPYFSWFSTFGNFEVMLVVLIILLFAFRNIWGGIVAFGLFGFFHIIEIFGKVMVDHPPPPQFMLRTEHAFDFPQYHVRLESSYPSGHSGRTVFIAVLLLLFIYKSSLPIIVKFGLYGGITGYVVIMLISRIYLGEHWMTDVVGGSLLALAFGIGSAAFLWEKIPLVTRAKKKHNDL